jgi:hypothetical protein
LLEAVAEIDASAFIRSMNTSRTMIAALVFSMNGAVRPRLTRGRSDRKHGRRIGDARRRARR